LSSISSLKADLRLLREKDGDLRGEAFARIRKYPRASIKGAYSEVRRVPIEPGWETDCLDRVAVEVPNPPIVCNRCICGVVSPGYEDMLDGMLDSLVAFGHSPDARVVIFAIDESYETLARRPDITRIRCKSIERLSPAVKGVIYSASRFIEAKQFLALEADVLIIGSIQPLWSLVDVVWQEMLLGVRPTANEGRMRMVEVGMDQKLGDIKYITGNQNFDGTFWFNGGVLAGNRAAFSLLDKKLRDLAPYSILWMEGGPQYRDELLMNLSLCLLNNATEFSASFNQQFSSPDRRIWVTTREAVDGMQYFQEGELGRILHFISFGRGILPGIADEIKSCGLSRAGFHK
jgi:hypothetical protein